MTRIRQALFTGGMVIAGLVLAAPNASAEVFWREHGEDDAYYNNVTDSALVCDRERDGNGVYGEYRVRTTIHHIGDANGSESGCGQAFIANVGSFRLCEDVSGDDSCTPWLLVR